MPVGKSAVDHFVKRFTLCYRTAVCLSCMSMCDVRVVWANGRMD